MCAFDKKLLLVALASSRIQKQKDYMKKQTAANRQTNKQTAKLDDIHNIQKDVIHMLGKRDMVAFLHVDNRTHKRIRLDMLRIDIVLGNQLAIVSIPGDRLSEIGSRMFGAQKEKHRGRSRRGRN